MPVRSDALTWMLCIVRGVGDCLSFAVGDRVGHVCEGQDLTLRGHDCSNRAEKESFGKHVGVYYELLAVMY